MDLGHVCRLVSSYMLNIHVPYTMVCNMMHKAKVYIKHIHIKLGFVELLLVFKSTDYFNETFRDHYER